MTPIKQDKELREKLDRLIIENQSEDGSIDISDQRAMRDEIMQLAIAYGERVALEARIDELENRLRVQFIPSHWARLCAEVNSWAKYVDRRIAELKAKQEEV